MRRGRARRSLRTLADLWSIDREVTIKDIDKFLHSEIVALPRFTVQDAIKGCSICLNEDRMAKHTLYGGRGKGEAMWYVIQVRVGTEEKIRLQCENRISKEVLEASFLPYYVTKRKVTGQWKSERRILFPGYVFLVTEQIQELFFELKKMEGLTKLLKVGEDIVPLSEKEESLLRRLGGEEHVVEMSEGIIEGSRVLIQSGPLQGLEAYIRRIDRHKRKAWLELEMFGRVQQVEIGLEITMKRV